MPFSKLFILPFLIVSTTWYEVNFFESDWENIPAGDCLMILGAKVEKDNTPSKLLRERLDTAIKIPPKDLKAIILSGGVRDDQKSEALVMKEYLLHAGISKYVIILEEESSSTYENFLFSKAHILKAGCENLDIISHRFHLPRVKMVTQTLKIPVNRFIPAEQKEPDTKSRLEREYKAYLWYRISEFW